MSYVLKTKTAPIDLVVSLYDMKLHLRVTNDVEDSLITSLIKSATNWCETYTRKQLKDTVLEMFVSSLPTCGFYLPRSPLSSLDSIEYKDIDGINQTISDSVYNVDEGGETPSKITLKSGQSFPSDIINERGAIKITFTCGYAIVPDDYTTAIKLLCGHWYENREGVIVGVSPNEVPFTVKAILQLRKVTEDVGQL